MASTDLLVPVIYLDLHQIKVLGTTPTRKKKISFIGLVLLGIASLFVGDSKQNFEQLHDSDSEVD